MEVEDGERNRSRIKVEDGETNQDGTNKELTEDLIVEIILKLPVKSQLRFKSVSKHWYSLIRSPRFISIHYKHNQNKNKVPLLCHAIYRGEETAISIWLDDVPKTVLLDSFIETVKILGCFNGVVCLIVSQSPKQASEFVLWNPATRQVRRIVGPGPMFRRWVGRGFCFDPVTNAFKVAQINFTVAKKEVGVTTAHVHMFSTVTNSWTTKNLCVPLRMWGKGYGVIQGATFVNRYMHFRMAITSPELNLDDTYILSYDMISDVFKRIEMPFQPVRRHIRLAGYEGSLFIFDHRQSDIDVWVKNYDCSRTDQPWYKVLTFRLPPDYFVSVFDRDGVYWVALIDSEGFMYLYNPETRETNRLWKSKSTNDIIQYSESLALLK